MSEAAAVDARPASVVFALVALGIDALGIGLIIPIVPALVRELAGGDASNAAFWVGALGTSFAAAQLFAAPILGGLSDRYGRRPILLLSITGLAADYVLLAAAPSLAWLFVGRLLAGITASNVSAITAYIADVTPPALRGQRFGLVGATFGLGFIVGPVMGGLLGEVWLRLPFLAAAVLSGCNALYGLFVLPESLPRARRRAFAWKRASPLGTLRVLRADPMLARLAIAWSCIWFSLGMLQSVFVLATGLQFGWGVRQNGFALAGMGVVQTVVQGLLLRHVLRWLGERRTAVLGFLLGALGQAMFAFAGIGWLIYAGVVVQSLGAIRMPAIRALFSARGGPERQGEIQGALAALQALMGIVAPLIGASVFAFFTGAGAPFHFPGAPFLLAAIVNLLGVAMIFMVTGEPG